MSQTPFTPPAFNLEGFHCPHCGAFAQQDWINLLSIPFKDASDVDAALCRHCDNYSVWVGGRMVYPDYAGVPPVNSDLDDDIQVDYNEAASIVDRSPRGAAALLRLAIQKTCRQLGQPGKSINGDVGALVQSGQITQRLQQALDVVRVVGNNAVHPGELDLTDDRETALALFQLVNQIAERAITQPKELQSLYDSLPEGPREQIEKRDSK